MSDLIHLIKLSVGSESVEQIEDWQRNRSKQRAGGHYYHITRMWPKREKELLNGGSIYWVVKGPFRPGSASSDLKNGLAMTASAAVPSFWTRT